MGIGLHSEDLVERDRREVQKLLLRRVERRVRADLVAHRTDHRLDPRPERSRRRHRQRLLLDIIAIGVVAAQDRSEEHTSELQSLMRISYAVFCLKKKK